MKADFHSSLLRLLLGGPTALALAVGFVSAQTPVDEETPWPRVDTAAKEAKNQTDINAAIDKARIEANKDATQALLDADKKKADAQAAFEKARVDAEKK